MTLMVKERQLARPPRVRPPLAIEIDGTLIHTDLFVETDQTKARAVARHLGLFDAVLASNREINFKSGCKAEWMSLQFPDGFVYAGQPSAPQPSALRS